jgi:hypothetical protein
MKRSTWPSFVAVSFIHSAVNVVSARNHKLRAKSGCPAQDTIASDLILEYEATLES